MKQRQAHRADLSRSYTDIRKALSEGLACSDTLILKDGQKIEGRYLSSTDSAVQFEVDRKPFT